MTFKRWKVCRSKKGGYYLASPSYSSEGDNGKKHWHPYIEFSGDKKREFDRKVLDLLKPLVNEGALDASGSFN
jgi:hypothetical protein